MRPAGGSSSLNTQIQSHRAIPMRTPGSRWEDMTIQEVGMDQRVQEQYVPDENVPIAIATDWRSLRRQYGARRVINNNATPI